MTRAPVVNIRSRCDSYGIHLGINYDSPIISLYPTYASHISAVEKICSGETRFGSSKLFPSCSVSKHLWVWVCDLQVSVCQREVHLTWHTRNIRVSFTVLNRGGGTHHGCEYVRDVNTSGTRSRPFECTNMMSSLWCTPRLECVTTSPPGVRPREFSQ